MAVTDPTLTTVLVLVMAGLVLIQTFGLLVALAKVSSQVRKTEQNLIRITSIIHERLAEAGGMLKRISDMKGYAEELGTRSNQVIDSAGDRIERTNDRIAGLLAAATDKVDASGRTLEYGLTQFTRQTTQLSREVHIPAKRISAVLKGVQVGLKTFLAREHSVPTQDEEIFI